MICAATFLTAAAVIAVVITTAPITRGWWLVAYLALVGGISQILLGSGLVALARRSGAGVLELRHKRAELVLWNAGAVIVAVADLAAAPGGVLAGSVLLVAALALFAGGLCETVATARRPVQGWVRMYAFLLGFLTVSVAVGAVLAYRGQT